MTKRFTPTWIFQCAHNSACASRQCFFTAHRITASCPSSPLADSRTKDKSSIREAHRNLASFLRRGFYSSAQWAVIISRWTTKGEATREGGQVVLDAKEREEDREAKNEGERERETERHTDELPV